MDLEQIEKKRAGVILQFAVPSVIAMILTSLVNIVDGVFVGRYIGKEGLAAVNLGLPIVYLYLAIGLMLAVGGISIAGRLLGANRMKEANSVFRQTIVACALVTVALTIVISVCMKLIAGMFETDALTQDYFVAYYRILIWELPLMILISAFGMFIRGEGKPVFVMLMNLLTVVLNTVFDYLCVAKLSLGMSGIAWSSFLSALIVLLVFVGYICFGCKVFHFGKFHFSKNVCREMIFNGSSEGIGEMSMCISMAAYNYIVLQEAGINGVAAFTIIGYVSYIFSMIIVGFGQGIVPIVSFAFGAQKRTLAAAVRNTSLRMVGSVAVVFFVVMAVFSGGYSRLFTDSTQVEALVTTGLRLQMASFLFAGINTIASFYFTAIGKAKESAVISASRGLVVLLIALFILPKLLGITGVWLVSLVTEVITLIFTVHYMRSDNQKGIDRAESEGCFLNESSRRCV